MNPSLRKTVLTTHIVFSVGWLGSVAGFLALSIASLTSLDEQVVRAACVAMNVLAWFVILPFAVISLLSGVIQSLGTSWGLVRYYWVLAKLGLTVVATIVLLLKLRLIGFVAQASVAQPLGEFQQARLELLVHSGGGLLVLLAATILSVFKPWGRTPFGVKGTGPGAREATSSPDWGRKALLVLVGALVLGFIVMHLLGGQMPMHGAQP